MTSPCLFLAHRHDDTSETKLDRVARNKLIAATIICFAFIIAELVGKSDCLSTTAVILVNMGKDIMWIDQGLTIY